MIITITATIIVIIMIIITIIIIIIIITMMLMIIIMTIIIIGHFTLQFNSASQTHAITRAHPDVSSVETTTESSKLF